MFTVYESHTKDIVRKHFIFIIYYIYILIFVYFIYLVYN